MKPVLRFYKPYLLTVFLIIALLFGQAMFELLLPRYMADIIDRGVLAGNLPYVFNRGGTMLLFSLCSISFSVSVGFFSARLAARASRGIRSALFSTVMGFSGNETDAFGTASLITRSTADIQLIQNTSAILFRIAFFAPVMGAGALIRAYRTSPGLSWTILVSLAAVFVILGFLFFFTLPKFKKVQQLLDRLNLITGERLTGILVIRAFLREESEEARFDEANRSLAGLNISINRAMSFLIPAMFLIMNLTSLLIVWAGADLISRSRLQVGEMLAFLQYSMAVILSFLFMSMLFVILPRAIVSAQRVGEVLSGKPAVADAPLPEEIPAETAFSPEVTFRNVSFRYPDAEENVLTDVSFTAEAGKTTALIGSTGSGKSTVVNLIPRFYDVTSGQILLNGTDIRRLRQQDLRERIGYISQNAVLFSGTVASNLRYGKAGAGEEEMTRAAETARALDFILDKEGGWNAPVSQSGSNLSGGQKQRLAIARALIKNPPILIFDDSFSALDFKTDAALRRSLSQKTGNAVVLVVAQRINTIRNADQILVFHEGVLIGRGRHADLMKSCGVYRQIANSQLSEEELSLYQQERGGPPAGPENEKTAPDETASDADGDLPPGK